MLKNLAKSKWMDFIGIGIVIIISILSGYLLETLNDVTHWGGWSIFVPFGIISIFNSCLSIMSTRLTTRMNNLGNILGVINAFLSGTIDYLLGNKAAIITYPVTFIVYMIAIKIWNNTDKNKTRKLPTGNKMTIFMSILLIATFIFSFVTNYIGFNGQTSIMYFVTSIVFSLSLTANILNAGKFTLQWKFWFIYNLAQLAKSLVQGNFANVGKYIYYIINALAGLDFWNAHDNKALKINTEKRTIKNGI